MNNNPKIDTAAAGRIYDVFSKPLGLTPEKREAWMSNMEDEVFAKSFYDYTSKKTGVDLGSFDEFYAGIVKKKSGTELYQESGIGQRVSQKPLGSPTGTSPAGDVMSFDAFTKHYDKDPKDTKYNIKRAYEIYASNPELFEKEIASKEEDGWHFPSVDPQTGVFLKHRDHPTVVKELEWYNSDDPGAVEFRAKHDLDTSGEYFRYVSKEDTSGIPPEKRGKVPLYTNLNPWSPKYGESVFKGISEVTEDSKYKLQTRYGSAEEGKPMLGSEGAYQSQTKSAQIYRTRQQLSDQTAFIENELAKFDAHALRDEAPLEGRPSNWGEQREVFKKLETARDFIKQANNLMQPDAFGKPGSVKQFLDGVFSGLTGVLARDFFSLGANELANLSNLAAISRKFASGEELTAEESAVINAYSVFQQAQSYQGDRSMRFNAAISVANMIPYIGQFILARGTVAPIRKGITELLETYTGPLAAKLAPVVAPAISMAVAAPTTAMMWSDYNKRIIGEPVVNDEGKVLGFANQEPVAKAVKNAFFTAYSELVTEEMGVLFTRPLSKLMGATGFKARPRTSVEDFTAWHGILGEYGEEFLNGYMQAGLTGDQPLRDVWDTKQQIETLITVAAFGGGMHIMQRPFIITENDLQRQYLRKLDEETKKAVIHDAGIMDKDYIARRLELYLKDQSLTEEQQENIFQYTLRSLSLRSSEMAKEAYDKIHKRAKEEMADAQIEGQEITIAEQPPAPIEEETQTIQDEKQVQGREETAEKVVQPTAEQLTARAEAIREANAEMDTKIVEAQTRLSLPDTPAIEITDDTEVTLEMIDNNEPVTNEFIEKASNELYEKYKELERMKEADTRLYTIEQIGAMQEFIGEEITKLESYAQQQKTTGEFVDKTKVGETTERGEGQIATEEVVPVDSKTDPTVKEDRTVGSKTMPTDKENLSVPVAQKQAEPVKPAEEVKAEPVNKEVALKRQELSDVAVSEASPLLKAEVDRLSEVEGVEVNSFDALNDIYDRIVSTPANERGSDSKKLKSEIEDIFIKTGFLVEDRSTTKTPGGGRPVMRGGVKYTFATSSDLWGKGYVSAETQVAAKTSAQGAPSAVAEKATTAPEAVSPEKPIMEEKPAAKRIFSEEKANEIRERLRKQRGQLNTVNPQMLGDALFMTGYYLETGITELADVSKRLIGEFGDAIRPYINELYEKAKGVAAQEDIGKATMSLKIKTDESSKDQDRIPGGQREGAAGQPGGVVARGGKESSASPVVAKKSQFQSIEDKAISVDPGTVSDLDIAEEIRYRTTARNVEISEDDVMMVAGIVRQAMPSSPGKSVSDVINDAVGVFVRTKARAKSKNIPMFESKPAVNKSADGSKHTTPHAFYDDAVSSKDTDKTKNLWMRHGNGKSNKGRFLLIQFSSDLLNGGRRRGASASERYFDKLYRNREGYARTFDFWEVPLWIARITGMTPKADVYVIRDMAEAKLFLAEAGYSNVAFSALDVNEKYISEVAASLPDVKFSVGGYTKFDNLKSMPNITIFEAMDEFARQNGLPDVPMYSYRHFAGTRIIPRLTMSRGCKHRCAFCSVARGVKPATKAEIDSQIESIRDLDAEYVYLDDKTFGHADNFRYLLEVYDRIKEFNPDFKGFIIQTTSMAINRMPAKFLKDAHIEYVELGVETYNEPILLAQKKPHSFKTHTDPAVKKLRALGIKFIPNIVVGFKQETAETYANTLNWLKDNMDIISHINVYALAIYEGTELADSIEVKSEADMNENTARKSFHKNPEVHEAAMDDFTALGERMLDKEPFTGKLITPSVTPLKRIFSEAKVEKIRERIKKQRGQLNTLNPQMFSDALYLAGYYMESGITKFADISKNLLEEFGEAARPHLKDLYDRAKRVVAGEDLNKVAAEPMRVEQAEPTKTEQPKAKQAGTRESKTSKTIRKLSDVDYAREVGAKIRALDPSRYTPKAHDEVIKQAVDWIGEHGGEIPAYELLVSKGYSPRLDEADVVTVAAQMLMVHFGQEVVLNDNIMSQAASVRIEELQTFLVEGLRPGARALAYWGMYKLLSPEGVVMHFRNMVRKANQEILNRNRKGGSYHTRAKQGKAELDKQLEKVAEKAAEKAMDNLDPAITRASTRKYQQMTENARKKRADLLKKYKPSDLFAASATGVTPEFIELVGGLAATYVEEGFYRVADIVDRIAKDIAGMGATITRDQVVDALEESGYDAAAAAEDLRLAKVRDKVLKADTPEEAAKIITGTQQKEKRPARPPSQKELVRKKVKEIAGKHWETRDIDGMAKSIVEELGIEGPLAEKIQEEVKKELAILVEQAAQAAMDKTMRPKAKRAKAARKTTLDKMISMINAGALESEEYIDIFADYFGLKEMTTEELSELKKLATVVQNTRGFGIIAMRAMADLSRFITNVLPTTVMETATRLFIGMGYNNLLSGYTTHMINLVSAGANVAMNPLTDMINPAKWVRDFRSGNISIQNPVFEALSKIHAGYKGFKSGLRVAWDAFRYGTIERSKYLDTVGNEKHRVQELERDVYSVSKARSWKSIAGSIRNLAQMYAGAHKFAGRALSAEDVGMTAFVSEGLWRARVRRYLVENGLVEFKPGDTWFEKIRKTRAATTRALTTVSDDMLGQLQDEVAAYEEGGNKLTDNQKKIRLKEIILEHTLAQEEGNTEVFRDVEDEAKDNIFTSTRYGAIANVGRFISGGLNKSLTTKVLSYPILPFVRILANVGEMTLDYSPYGFVRAGFGGTLSKFPLSGASKRRIDQGLNARTGARGSDRYYAQMGRAALGTIVYGIAMAALLDPDDDNKIVVTGGLVSSDSDKTQGESKKVRPTWSIGLRRDDGTVKWLPIKYIYLPPVAMPLAMVGTLNDILRKNGANWDKDTQLRAEHLAAGFMQSISIMKDMTFAEGVVSFAKMTQDFAAIWETGLEFEDRFAKAERMVNEMAKTYGGMYTKWLPINNNLIRQSVKLFDDNSYSQKTLEEIFQYNAGLVYLKDFGHPNLDIFGETIVSAPGETQFNVDRITKKLSTDPRWVFLAKHNAIPSKMDNSIKFHTKNVKLPYDLYAEMVIMAGERFSQSLQGIMKTPQKVWDLAGNAKVAGKIMTPQQEDVHKAWEKAKTYARDEMKERLMTDPLIEEAYKKLQKELDEELEMLGRALGNKKN